MKINVTPIRKDSKFISNKVLLMSVIFHVALFVLVGYIDLYESHSLYYVVTFF